MHAIVSQGRHVFWTTPVRVPRGLGGYPVVNRMGQFGGITGFRFPNINVPQVTRSFQEQAFREKVAGGRELDETARQNLDLALRTWTEFPFPPPAGLFRTFWLNRAGHEIADPVFSGQPIIPEQLRVALALSSLDHYDEVMADIQEHERKRAKKKKKRALIKKIVTGIVGTVIGILVPVAGAVWAIGETALSSQERRDAAKDLEKAAKQFDTEDTAFAAELRKAAQIMDYEAAQTQAAAALSQEEREAIEEKDEEATAPGAEGAPAEGPAVPTELLVGGGLAAAAGIALFFFA